MTQRHLSFLHCYRLSDEMDPKVLDAIADFMNANKVSYKWQKVIILQVTVLFFFLSNLPAETVFPPYGFYYRATSLQSTTGESRYVYDECYVLHNSLPPTRIDWVDRLVMHSRNPFTGPRRVYASMFGDILGTNVAKRDCVGEVMEDFSSLEVSDPTTFGMWRLDDPEDTVYHAIVAGYRRFDSACDYGNEVLTGRGIRRAIDEGVVKRGDLYITTKLWNTYHHPDHVPQALDRCLQDFGLDYVDEFLIHFPISMEVRRQKFLKFKARKTIILTRRNSPSLCHSNTNILLSGRTRMAKWCW